MLKLQKISPPHEDLFIQHYERLRSWALQLTHSDRGRAEDLLHDAFIQFTISQPDLKQIKNLDGYLYGTLRNLHLSQVRKATRSRLQQLSIVEYESAETGLRTVDPRDLIQVQDQLRQVCHLRVRAQRVGAHRERSYPSFLSWLLPQRNRTGAANDLQGRKGASAHGAAGSEGRA